jgi:Fanconi anemia group M protein
MPHETLSNIKPRKYQEEIYNTCKDKNCLVVLPTGIGKTLIALMLTINRIKKYPASKILFLAPTRPLAEQHLEYFKKNLPELFAQLDLFTGKVDAPERKKIWQSSEIIFSTPQCIANDLQKGLYDLKEVSLLIEDECHRCLKNYAYTFVAQKYKEQATNSRILGLTASPGAEKKIIEQIAKNLQIEAIELRTRESNDVKEYLQELEFEIVKLEFPPEFQKIKSQLIAIFNRKVEELKNRKLLFMPPTKKFLLETQHRIMRTISSGNKNFNILAGASACAIAIKIQHALELLETQTLFSLQNYFYELFKQAKENKSKAVQNLIKMPEFNQAFIAVNELLAKRIENPKLAELKRIVTEDIKENPKAKIIIFSQFRDNVTRICREMNSIPEIKARVFVGQAKKTTNKIGSQEGEETGLTQKEQQQMIRDFSSGEINIICATSIAEEGLDIPEVNAVIFYEPIPSAIRTIQRRGRTARLTKGKLIILLVLKTRDEAYYWSAFHKEKKMYNAIKSIKEDLDSGELSFIEAEQEDEETNKEQNEEIKEEENEEEQFIPEKPEQKTLFDINKK